MAKGRSPNYPSLTLAEAVERLRQVYEGVHTYPTPKEVFAENMGYSGLSGRALTFLGTFKRYGLVDSEPGGNLRVSPVAVSIIELPKGSPEWARAVEQAAFAPNLFSELHQEFPEELPNDGLLRHHLIKKGFLPKAADEIIRVYKANLELVEEKRGEYNPPMTSSATEPQLEMRVRREGAIRAHRNVVEENEKFLPQWEYRFNVSRSTMAKVIFVGGEATQEAIGKLISVLEVQKDTFPTEADLREIEQIGGTGE